MPPLTQDPATVGKGSHAYLRSTDMAEEVLTSADGGRKLYNLPSRSEKLTDATLPLSWPVPYLDNMKAGDEVPPIDGPYVSPAPALTAPISTAHHDYAQLMRKLHEESALVRSSKNGDKALCAAHYISTLIAAMAFVAMMGIVILNFFPALTHP